MFGYGAIIVAIILIFQWKWSQGEMESARQALMARQRAVAVELGPRWTPMRDKIEKWTLDLAKEAGPEVIDKSALADPQHPWDFREKAGLYLRMRAADVTSAEDIRKKARDSLRDAFTACLMRVSNPNPLAGKECLKTRECPSGEFCNENDHCSRPAQPFNLRVAYRTLFVLSDEWVRDVQDANSDIRLRLLTTSFDDTTKDDLPLAADLLARAQYFMLVLDEDPAEKLEKPTLEAIEATTHQARIGVWRLSDDKLVLRVRREAAGQLLGATPAVDVDVMDARQRQANSCALALAVREAMGDRSGAALPGNTGP